MQAKFWGLKIEVEGDGEAKLLEARLDIEIEIPQAWKVLKALTGEWPDDQYPVGEFSLGEFGIDPLTVKIEGLPE